MRLRPFALLAGLAAAAPAIYGALVTGTVPVGTATTRTLVALLVATVLTGAFEGLVAGYGRPISRSLGNEEERTPEAGSPAPLVGVPVARRRTDVTQRDQTGAS